MSFYSSLVLFYPGVPPVVSPETLHRFCDEIHRALNLQPDYIPSRLEVKYGKKIDQDYKTTNIWEQDKKVFGIFRRKEYKWDDLREGASWSDIPKDWMSRRKNIYRAHVSLGILPREGCDALAKKSENYDGSGIHPYCVSVEIDPIRPATLDAGEEDLVCTGLVGVDISGPGYFSWGADWREYAAQYAVAKPIVEAKRVTRSMFPVRRDAGFEKIADHLGKLFLNRDCYQEGDWILSVSESG